MSAPFRELTARVSPHALEAEIIVGKQHNGAGGTVKLQVQSRHVCLGDLWYAQGGD